MDYFRFARHNLCVGVWSAADASVAADRLRARYPSTPIVMLGRKVARGFGYAGPAFSRDGLLVAIPHPSGLCRTWNDPEAVPRVRALLAEQLFRAQCIRTNHPYHRAWRP